MILTCIQKQKKCVCVCVGGCYFWEVLREVQLDFNTQHICRPTLYLYKSNKCVSLDRTVRRTGTLLASIWMVNLVTMVPVATISRLEPMWEVGSLRYYCVVFFNSAAQRQVRSLHVPSSHSTLPQKQVCKKRVNSKSMNWYFCHLN